MNQENVDKLYDLLHTLSPKATVEEESSLIDKLADIMHTRLMNQSWFPKRNTNWGQTLSWQCAVHIIKRIQTTRQSQKDDQEFDRWLNFFIENIETIVFFVPEVIRLIYSPHKAEYEGLVNEGVNQHCRLIRRATATIVRRHAGSLRNLSMNVQEIQDELWGNVLEELVRSLSDTYARVWQLKKNSRSTFPMESVRGRRRGIILRVALSKDGTQLAAFRSDWKLFLWYIDQQELINSWDISPFTEKQSFDQMENIDVHLFFNHKATRIAFEHESRKVAVINNNPDEHPSIRYFDESERDDFFRYFGEPYIPDFSSAKLNGYPVQTRSGNHASISEYLQQVFDWSTDTSENTIATASEQERFMPQWMEDAGFERAIYHIAKKRLIDLIRKYTHTNLACWRCGTFTTALAETQCHQCGTDFTRCPVGCELLDHEKLGPKNYWQCPRCGMASKVTEIQQEVEMADRSTGTAKPTATWESEHDFDRILNAVHKLSVAHKDRILSCEDLLKLKADGKTNEEIGQHLGIPRGSVDYVWNQCKKQILLTVGEQ